MVDEDDKMHGSIFVLLRKFVASTFSPDFWAQRIDDAGIQNAEYIMTKRYPTNDIFKLLQSISIATGMSHHELQEKFGQYLVPDLLTVYGKYVDPSWKSYDLLKHTESMMHAAVRIENEKANPPILNISPVSDNLLIIDYHSKRRMASLAIGIIKGIAKYYNEEKVISVKSATGLNDERVQIRVEFDPED